MEANLQPTNQVGMFFVADQSRLLVVPEAEVSVDMGVMVASLVEGQVETGAAVAVFCAWPAVGALTTGGGLPGASWPSTDFAGPTCCTAVRGAAAGGFGLAAAAAFSAAVGWCSEPVCGGAGGGGV